MSRLVAIAILALALSACLFGERLDIAVENTSSAPATIEILAGTSDDPIETIEAPDGQGLRFHVSVPDDWSVRVDGAVVIDSSSFSTDAGPILVIHISPTGVTTGNTAEG